MAGINALLVDDHTLFRSALKALLVAHSVEIVAEAADAVEAARQLSSLQLDLVLLDYELPDLNGAQLVRAMRGRHNETPVLMLSMHSDALTIRAAFEAGANGYVTKMADAEELLIAIRQVAAGLAYLPKRLAHTLNRRSSKGVTVRQFDTLQYIANGRTNEEIARELNVSVSTVKGDIRALFAALGCKERTRLVSEACRTGMLTRAESPVAGATRDNGVSSCNATMNVDGY